MHTMEAQWTRVASYSELKKTNCLTVSVNGHTLVLFAYGEAVYAVDNRCPHMGFPLNKGTVKDGILTCHWHHARFDLASGGTFDLWADDVPGFRTRVEADDILVDLSPHENLAAAHEERVQIGLEQNLTLVLAKSVLGLQKAYGTMSLPFRLGLRFGTRYRSEGWGQGLTILGCMNNLLEYLDEEQKPRALYHGLSAVANNTAMSAPHFSARSLPNPEVDIATLKNWFRQFIEVRDSLGAERVIISALRAGADDKQMADMIFAAATDHRYIQIGHVLDFINKAFECLDVVGWNEAEEALASLAPILADASRQEESIEWRSPIDLVEIVERAFTELPSVLANAKASKKADFEALVPILLDDNPQAIVDALMQALRDGVQPESLAGLVAYSAALRIAQFHTSNEFGDWDTALHTFTFANAVHSGLRRVNSPDLLRGVFDAAMSVYLDRFLNIPAAKIPEVQNKVDNPAALLSELESLLNLQQQVNEAALLVAKYLHSGGDAKKLMAILGKLLLREDRDFHTIQCIEAAFRQYSLLKGSPYADKVLIAASRYLAAHAPTMRSQGQTYQIALRLARGENLFEG